MRNSDQNCLEGDGDLEFKVTSGGIKCLPKAQGDCCLGQGHLNNMGKIQFQFSTGEVNAKEGCNGPHDPGPLSLELVEFSKVTVDTGVE
jgi:hypothetical protein